MSKEKTMAKKQTVKKTSAKKTSMPKSKAGNGRVEPKKGAKEERPEAQVALTPDPKSPAPTPTVRDPRLPAVGAVIQKRDRHGAVRCECTIEKSGVRYAGRVFRSLSSAAMAAAKDLGLNNKTQNGFTFWGLSKPPRPSRDPLETLDRAWTRYHGNVEVLLQARITLENRAKVVATLKKHAQTIESLRESATAA